MTHKQQPACPECEKLAEVANESNRIGDFLNYFLDKKGLYLARYVEVDGYVQMDGEEIYLDEVLMPASEYRGDGGINCLLAEYYGIDLEKVEQERRALLDWLREVQSDRD